MGRKQKTCGVCKRGIKYRYKKYATQLNELVTAKAKKRKQILNKADKCLINLLCECALNVLKGKVVLPEKEYKKLKKHKGALIKVSEPGVSLTSKSNLLKKKGGFLPLILPAIVSALGGFAGESLSRALRRS